MNKIGVFGGSGFVGSYIVRELILQKFQVKTIGRTPLSGVHSKLLSQLTTNLFSENLHSHLTNLDCIIYNIGIIRDYPHKGISFKKIHTDLAVHCIDMAKKAGVKKIILMSANGVEQSKTKYQSTKLQAEHYLKKSGLDWTIFRPSLIYGDPKGKVEFCSQIKRDMIKTPFPLPIFFNGINIFNAGSFRMSPIHVKNIAQFFVSSIRKDESNGKIYELGGSRTYSWKEITRIISDACNKKKWRIPVPFSLLKLCAFFFDRWSWFPFSREQLTMLRYGNVCESSKYFSEYDIDEIIFNVENLDYLS